MISEVPKTDKSFEERLIFKTFILKFVNAFSPIIYIAFFRGRLVQHSFQLHLITSAWFSKGSFGVSSPGSFVGRPGSYLYVFESYRMEEVTTHSHTHPLGDAGLCPASTRLLSQRRVAVCACVCQCAHGGCLMELCIQLSITMLGKQLIQNNLFEIGIP